ncbi:MAG: hypothetical protein K8T90_05495, partial [Planctomycetes bacterium]|nr:hypothetical protein [Planctomycetota bacterium]
FSDAWIGAVHRAIRDQTGIEVVVDAQTWRGGRQITWHSDPVPLGDAITAICREMQCTYRVRDKRIFLLQP